MKRKQNYVNCPTPGCGRTHVTSKHASKCLQRYNDTNSESLAACDDDVDLEMEVPGDDDDDGGADHDSSGDTCGASGAASGRASGVRRVYQVFPECPTPGCTRTKVTTRHTIPCGVKYGDHTAKLRSLGAAASAAVTRARNVTIENFIQAAPTLEDLFAAADDAHNGDALGAAFAATYSAVYVNPNASAFFEAVPVENDARRASAMLSLPESERFMEAIMPAGLAAIEATVPASAHTGVLGDVAALFAKAEADSMSIQRALDRDLCNVCNLLTTFVRSGRRVMGCLTPKASKYRGSGALSRDFFRMKVKHL